MGSIIERIDDRIDEFGTKEAYLAFLEGTGEYVQVAPSETDVMNIPTVEEARMPNFSYLVGK